MLTNVRRRLAAALLTTGALAFVAGGALLAAEAAPMLGTRDEAANTAATSLAGGNKPGAGPVGDSVNKSAAPSIVDKPVNGVAFRIQVPVIGYASKVFEGIDEKTLLRGPGHYPTSAWPGRDGTVGVAAHNVYWLSFSRLKVGDRVVLRTSRGAYVYAITGIKITVKTDVSVLQPSSERRLTMTTCYPLWAGEFATKRLVFLAREIASPQA